jgi:acetolactate synthase I/III small subunit
MNIVLRGQDGVVEQARRQLEDVVPVWVVLDYTNSMIVERELLLAKVSILGPEHFHELIAHHKGDFDEENSEHENPEVWNNNLNSSFLVGQ